MAQNYASRPVTRIASGSAAAAALTQVSGIQSDVRLGPVAASAPPTAQVFDRLLGLPIPELREQLESATSEQVAHAPCIHGSRKGGHERSKQNSDL